MLLGFTKTARVLWASSSREKTEGLSHLIRGNGPLYVCDSVWLSDRFSLAAGSDQAGSVLIRREIDVVILSALVTGRDKAEYYSKAMFCKCPPSSSH